MTIRNLAALAVIIALLGLGACKPPGSAAHGSLAWAYPRAAAAPLPEPPPGPQHVPGSPLTLTHAQVNDEHNPPDWSPQEHPAPPPIVAHGQAGGPTPCGECHLISGTGFLGAPSLAGLSQAYIVGQVHAYRSGLRRSAEHARPATQEMIAVADKVSEPDLAAAAAYYASLQRRRWVRVVETGTVPATRPDYYGWLDLVPGGKPEPTAGRIIEVAEDWGRMTVEDPHSGIVAYVPPRAIERGAALVRTGGAAGQPCGSCHGAGLQGTALAPPLAGRSPAYLARQLWDIHTGARSGPSTAAMQAPAKRLNEAQITDVVAYLASLDP